MDEEAPLYCKCGYCLLGLHSNRCPECGAPFEARALRRQRIRQRIDDLVGKTVFIISISSIVLCYLPMMAVTGLFLQFCLLIYVPLRQFGERRRQTALFYWGAAISIGHFAIFVLAWTYLIFYY